MAHKSFRIREELAEKLERISIEEDLNQSQLIEKIIDKYAVLKPSGNNSNCQQNNDELDTLSQDNIHQKVDKLLENQKLIISLLNIGNKDSFISKEMLNSFLIEMEYEPFAFKTTTNDKTTHDWVHKANDIYRAKINESMKNKKLRGE